MKLYSLVLSALLCIGIALSVGAAGFSDVSPDDEFYTAITELSHENILTGYEGGLFKPDGFITRAEAATVLSRASGLSSATPVPSYTDVPEDFWGYDAIMAVSDAGIMNGMGNGIFAPQENVTYYQLIKMIVCMAGLEEKAANEGGWPDGYEQIAYSYGLIDSSLHWNIVYSNRGNQPADRRTTAGILYNTLVFLDRNTLNIGKQQYHLGMDADILAEPDEIVPSAGNFDWYVYDTDTYKKFYAAGVADGTIVALAAVGDSFSYNGYVCGDKKDETSVFAPWLYADSNNNGKIHGVCIVHPEYQPDIWQTMDVSAEQLAGESKMNFHFTNAFRVWHKRTPFRWSDPAAKAARLHSEDMAEYDYFDHTNRKGLSMAERMEKQGISWSSCAENIYAGTADYLGFYSYNGWVNSEGHRSNMLNKSNKYLGVGIAYHPDSTFKFYHTQNFFAK